MAEYTRHADDLLITVDKVGGGTYGREYEGSWEVTVSLSGTVVLDDVINTGTPKTHREVADIALDFIDDADMV